MAKSAIQIRLETKLLQRARCPFCDALFQFDDMGPPLKRTYHCGNFTPAGEMLMPDKRKPSCTIAVNGEGLELVTPCPHDKQTNTIDDLRAVWASGEAQ